MSDSEQQHSSSHRRFNDDDDEEQHQPDSVSIISPKDYNSIKQCTDLSRRSILNPAIGAPVWTAISTQTRTPRSKHGKSLLLFSTASFHMDLEYCNTKTGSNLERVEAVTVTPQQDWDHLVLSFMRGPSMMIFRAEFRRITREMDEWSASLEENDLLRYRQQLISCYEAAVEDGVVPNRDNVTLGTLSADSSQSRRARFTAYGAEYGFGEANDESYEANAAQDSQNGLNMQPPPIFGHAAYQSPYQGTTERGARTPMASAVRQTVRRPAEKRVSFKPR